MSVTVGWPRVPLSEAYWFQEGPGVRKWQFTTSGIKLLNVGNIEKDGTLNLSKTERCLDESEVTKKYSHFLVDEGDLVIASSGISFDDDGLLRTRGAFVENRDLPLCLNTSTIRFKAIDGVSDLRFLRIWLNGREFRSQITKLVTGTAQQNFGPSHLKATKITLPSLVEQRRIAEVLDRAEALRAKRRAALAQLDTLTQSIFLDVFGDPTTNPNGFSKGNIEVAVKDPKKDIRCGPFGTQLKVHELVDSGIPLLGIENVLDEGFRPETRKFLTDMKAKELRAFDVAPGDVLVTRMGTIGRACVVPETFTGGRFSYHLFRIRPDIARCVRWVVDIREHMAREFRPEDLAPSQELDLASSGHGDTALSSLSFGFSHVNQIVHEVHISPKQR